MPVAAHPVCREDLFAFGRVCSESTQFLKRESPLEFAQTANPENPKNFENL